MAAPKRRELAAIIQHLLNTNTPVLMQAGRPYKEEDTPLAFDAALAVTRSIKGMEAAKVIGTLDGWGMRPYVETLLNAGTRAQRIRALAYLSQCSDTHSLETIIAASGDGDGLVQLAALRALSKRGETAHIALVLQHMEKAGQRNTLALTEILRSFGPDAAGPLAELVLSGRSLEIRLACASALGAIGVRDATMPLIRLAQSADTPVELKARALQSLGRIGDGRAEDAILAGLTSPHQPIRVQAAKAAGALALLPVLPVLTDMLDDPDWWVRYRAAESLVRLGHGGVAILKARQAQNRDPDDTASQLLRERSL